MINIIKLIYFKILTKYASQLFHPKYSKNLWKYAGFTNKINYLKLKSTINSKLILSLITTISFSSKDVRASWIGHGIPNTNSNNPKYKNFARWALEHLMIYTPFIKYIENRRISMNILDLGCGVGYATNCLAYQYLDSTITGIDYDMQAIYFANHFNNRKNIRYICKDFFEYEENIKYDYIFATEILEHISSEKHLLFVDKCLSMLNQGGKLFISTPNGRLEKDGDYGHIGLLNYERAINFYSRFKSNITEFYFINNKLLYTRDLHKFVLRDNFNNLRKNYLASHFNFVIERQ